MDTFLDFTELGCVRMGNSGSHLGFNVNDLESALQTGFRDPEPFRDPINRGFASSGDGDDITAELQRT